MNRFSQAVIALAVYVAAQACTSDGGTDPPTPVPTSIQVSQTAVSLNALGATATLTATVRDQSGNPIAGSSVTWSSNPEAVATVNASGTVTAVSVGTATVTATSGSLTANVTVTVTQEPAAADPVGGDAQSGTVGQALGTPLTVQINDAGGNPIPDVPVTFAVTSGGGSVSPVMVPSVGAGEGSTTWTLGTGAGEQQVTVNAGGQATRVFTATGTPDAPAAISAVSGDMQQGPTGAQLPDPIVVKVADQFGNGVEGETVAFAITDGGDGLLSSVSGTTDAAGEASTMWTLDSSEGQNTVEASAAGLSGSPVMFTATGTNLAVASVSPDPIVEGGIATITGQGFSAIPGNNTVTVDGATANVRSALFNTIEIDVPTFDCRPARMVDVVVTTGGVSEGISHPVRPAEFFTVPVGEQVIISDPSEFCLQFDATANDERFLVGVTSVSPVATSRTEVKMTGVTSSGSTAPPLLTPSPSATRTVNLGSEHMRRMEWMERHRALESRVLMQSIRDIPRGAPPAAPGVRRTVPSDVEEGDTVEVRVPSFDDLCNMSTTITTVARKIGTSGVWLEDIDNDANGFTDDDFQSFSDKLDTLIYAMDTQTFGDPPDVDGNNRLVAVITKEVNKTEGLGGFVSSADFFDEATCPASNVGEIFYGLAPDTENSVAALLPFMPVLIAHEFVHVIQLGRRIFANASVFPSVWELEGGATFGENRVGLVAEGLGLNAMDLDNNTVFDIPGTASGRWFFALGINVAQYMGLDRTMSPPGRLADAPHDCTWQIRDEMDDECTLDGNEPYGVPGSFLWWISDQFGPTYTGGVGGVEGIQQAIIDNSDLQGFDNIETIIGVPIDSLLMQWQAAFYMDNRVVDGMVIPSNSRLTFKTWNFFSILENTTSGGVPLRMTPKALSFADADQNVFVRSGSTAFFLLTGNGRLATALRVRDAADGTLPSTMRLWVTGLK